MRELIYISEYPLSDGTIERVKYKTKATATNGVCIACDHYYGKQDFRGVVYEKDIVTKKKRLVFELNEKRR